MDLYIYCDESGVFDKKHYNDFIYGGIIFLSKERKDDQERSFLNIEKRLKAKLDIKGEMKANKLNQKDKYNLYRSFSKGFKFITHVDLTKIYDQIFSDKKTKQRYQDFAFKMGLKHALKELMRLEILKNEEIKNIYIYLDEHTNATNGRYNLKESLDEEFRKGMFSSDFSIFFEPLFTSLERLEVKYLNSKDSPLIRVSDIISNYAFSKVRSNQYPSSIFIKLLP